MKSWPRKLFGNIALALAAPILFFALLEGALALAGVRPLYLTEDPFVGFASLQPLFVEKKGSDGRVMMVTSPAKLTHFNLQSFPRDKDAGTFRIFTLGGSTTYGHPWRDPVSYSGWLREILPAADSSRRWEVINAGGISYASYREAKLVEELCRYHPDLFIIYSGHNEFLEERTYRKAAALPAVVREASALLDHTRTYTLMRGALRGLRAAKPAAGPAAGTLERGAPELAGEVDDVLAKTIGPTSYTRNDTLRQDVLDHYRVSLERMARLAHAAGARILFLTTPGNEKDCSPFKSEPTPGLGYADEARVQGWLQAAAVYEAGGKAADAVDLLDSAAGVDNRNASVLYRAGIASFKAMRYPRAKSYFRRALDEDVCPLRALTPMRAIVLAAARAPGAAALDFVDTLERKTRAEAGHDILGEPDFVDHVHLSIEDYRLLALSLLRKLEEMGVAHPAGFGQQGIDAVTARVMAGMGPKEMGEGLHNLAKVTNWAGKHDDAARIAERGLAVDSTSLEAIWSSLFVGAARERQGKEEEAIPHYRRAVRLDSTNLMSRHYLAAALMRAGRDGEAAAEFTRVLAADPGDAPALENLGLLELRLGQAQQALNHLGPATQQSPGRADLQYSLGEALRQAGRAGEAEMRFRQALGLNPREARALLGLGRLEESKGDRARAIEFYAQALRIAPDLREAQAALSRNLGSLPR
jgi:tetratricopeptide (TPR) repeat protein